MATPQSLTKANLLAEIITQITGQRPSITAYDSYTQLDWTPSQQKVLIDKINNELNKKRVPSDVRVNLNPIIFPIVVQKALPYVAIALGVSFLGGFLIGKR